MYIAKYYVGDKLYNRMHVNNCEQVMRKRDNVCKVISYEYAYNWRRFKDRSKNLLVVINKRSNDIIYENIGKEDVFYNKAKHIFCIENDLDKMYNMKTHKIRYRKKVCKLKRIGSA